MGYDVAINKAWEDLLKVNSGKSLEVKFFADRYSLDLEARRILSLACNVPAKDFTAILILHYLAKKAQGLPRLKEEWLPFRELSGIEGYYDAFRKRSIEPIIRKYGSNPEGILQDLARFSAKVAKHGDVGITLDAFEGVPALVALWRADEEFGADANIFFDKSITEIFCIEDIVVLAGMVAAQI